MSSPDQDKSPQEMRSLYARYASAGNLVLGIWLVMAPVLFDYRLVSGRVNDTLIGLLLVATAIVRVLRPIATGGVSWFSFLIGAWLVFSPPILGHPTVSNVFWIDITTGLLVLVLAAMSLGEARDIHE